jgi:hypothetical protein
MKETTMRIRLGRWRTFDSIRGGTGRAAFPVGDTLDRKFARFQQRRAAERACATCDAGTTPTKENIEAFYKNALRSSGAENEAYEKTVKFFDLEDLEIDADGRVVSFKVADSEPQRDDELSPDDYSDDEPENRAMEFSNGTADHVSALRSLNDRNQRVHDRRTLARADDRAERKRPTVTEQRLLTPHVGHGGSNSIQSLVAFNELARRFWGTRP